MTVNGRTERKEMMGVHIYSGAVVEYGVGREAKGGYWVAEERKGVVRGAGNGCG